MIFGRKTIEKKIYIEGLKCGGCVKRVENVLKSFKEIKTLEVSLENKCATIQLKKDLNNSVLTEAITNLGFSVTSID